MRAKWQSSCLETDVGLTGRHPISQATSWLEQKSEDRIRLELTRMLSVVASVSVFVSVSVPVSASAVCNFILLH